MAKEEKKPKEDKKEATDDYLQKRYEDRSKEK